MLTVRGLSRVGYPGVISAKSRFGFLAFIEFTLERKEGSLHATGASDSTSGFSFPVPSLIPTTMQILKTLIPLTQPGGLLTVPTEDWDALNEFLAEHHGGHIHVRETRERGFTLVGDHGKRGLLCYELALEVPDDVDVDTVTNGEFDAKLTETIQRNVRAVRVPEAA